MKILMPVFTVAEWGGLHENALHNARVLAGAGHEITFVCRSGKIAEQASLAGLTVVEVDWSNWNAEAALLKEYGDYELILTQLQEARKFAFEVRGEDSIPVIVQIQGFWTDTAHTWRTKVDAWISVAPALTNLLAGYSKVEPWRIVEVPNAVQPRELTSLTQSFSAKLSDNVGRVVLVSRIDEDKRHQRKAAIELAKLLAQLRPEIDWIIDIYGDGPERALFEVELDQAVGATSNVSYIFNGWVEAEKVPEILARGFVSVAAGRGALQSIAVGTPCFGSGKFGDQGLQDALALRIGLWSNFGDYPAGLIPSFDIESQVRLLLDGEQYSIIQEHGQSVVAVERDSEVADQKLLSLIGDFSREDS